MERVRLADHAVRPRLAVLHHHHAADGPVVLALRRVVVVRAPEVGRHHHHQAVRHAVLFRVVPQEVHGVGEIAEQPAVIPVVVVVGVEAPLPQVGAHRRAGLERQHRKLGLAAQGAVVGVGRAFVALYLLQLIFRRQGIGKGAQALGGEGRAVERAPARFARQAIHRRRQPIRAHGAVALQDGPIFAADERAIVVVVRCPGRCDFAQPLGLADAREARHAAGFRIAAEAQVGHGESRAVLRGQQRGEGGIALGGATAPVVDDAHGVRVGLRIHAVDDQHSAVVLLEERLVVGEGRVGEVAGLLDVAGFRPVVDGALAGLVRLRIAEAGGVPGAVRLHADEERARVVGGMGHRQPESGDASRAECALEQRASFHRCR